MSKTSRAMRTPPQLDGRPALAKKSATPPQSRHDWPRGVAASRCLPNRAGLSARSEESLRELAAAYLSLLPTLMGDQSLQELQLLVRPQKQAVRL